MANRETHIVDTFEATDEFGDEYTIHEYQEVMERRFIDKPSEWVKSGPRWFRLDSNAVPVNQLDADTFEIATTGARLNRVR